MRQVAAIGCVAAAAGVARPSSMQPREPSPEPSPDFREEPTDPHITSTADPPPEDPSMQRAAQRITGSFRVIRVARVDRWIWLGLGVLVLLITLASSIAWGAPAEVVTVVAANEADPLADMIRTSGPAGGLVLLLGYFIRTWQANNTTQLKELRDTIKELQGSLQGAHNSDGKMREDFAVYRGEIGGTLATIRADQAALVDRVSRIERRTSGTHPRGE